MEIWTILEEDHRKVETILERLYEDGAGRADLLRQLRRELVAHSKGEEQAVYPVLRDLGGFEQPIDHARDEHEQLVRILGELDILQGDQWSAALQHRQKAVRDHIEEEEWRLFPLAKKELPYHVTEHMKHAFEAAKHEMLES